MKACSLKNQISGSRGKNSVIVESRMKSPVARKIIETKRNKHLSYKKLIEKGW